MNSQTVNVPLRELLFIAPSRKERKEHKRIVALFASLREYTYVSEFGMILALLSSAFGFA
jgi:hypothetical protein